MRYADEYLKGGGGTGEAVNSLLAHYSQEQLVELDMVLGIVNLVNHFIASFGIEIEKGHIAPGEAEALRKRMGRKIKT
ncbi:MAG: hypothetical protein HY695_34255 [Deltaproteobacteria bacterium]|nr:hypothetical protein [Deltaproteobacteria bacterium]